ncbi:MAG TPA: hypothetical protein VE174_01265 [Actinomycetota bacterium]|nr:hypothetical protein [Actinomycetota bacterium]
MRGRAVLIFTVLATFAACGELEPVDDLLFLQTPRGVAVVRADASAPTFFAAGALPSRDWSSVIRTRWSGHSTRVAASIPASGTKLWNQGLRGTWVSKVVSEEGNMAVLSPARENHYSIGRRTTKLAVVGRDARARYFDLRGNLEPEAFSTDKSSLFVLQYRPARRPTSYQVRRLDLSKGKLHDIYTPDKHLQEAMRGDARVQAVSPDGRRLYTLYSLRTSHGTHSFIHVLALDEMWAHCIDLPQEFGIGAGATSLSVSEDGRRLFVANAVADAVAEIDVQALRVVDSAGIELGSARTTHSAQSRDALYVGNGSNLIAIDLDRLVRRSAWALDESISGIQVEEDAGYLYVGLKDRIVVIDAASGERVRSLDPPGVKRIGLLGRATRTINAVPEHFSCAC